MLQFCHRKWSTAARSMQSPSRRILKGWSCQRLGYVSIFTPEAAVKNMPTSSIEVQWRDRNFPRGVVPGGSDQDKLALLKQWVQIEPVNLRPEVSNGWAGEEQETSYDPRDGGKEFLAVPMFWFGLCGDSLILLESNVSLWRKRTPNLTPQNLEPKNFQY